VGPLASLARIGLASGFLYADPPRRQKGPTVKEELIVAGWFTPDYRPWAAKLVASCEAVGVPHDVVEVHKLAGSWERNTCRKPAQILAALDRHPGRTIVFVDADAVVLGDLAPLARIRGDIGIRMTAKHKAGRGVRVKVLSGTIVVQPTPAARAFIEAWKRQCEAAAVGDNDQMAFGMALGAVTGIAIEPLAVRYCAVAGDRLLEPVILHDSASRNTAKIGTLRARLAALSAGIRAAAEEHAWNRFRRRYGAAVPCPPGLLRRLSRAVWGLLAGAMFMVAWLLALAVIAAPVVLAWKMLVSR
jgi:hypothetical protein